jgi:hypothetical protein
MKQEVLTPAEYAAQGYILRDDFDASAFQLGSYETDSTFDVNFLNIPVYRSETKEEYYRDAIVGVFRVGWAFYSGGVGPMGWATLEYIAEVTESD